MWNIYIPITSVKSSKLLRDCHIYQSAVFYDHTFVDNKKFQFSNSDQRINLPSRIKYMENFTKRLAESRNLSEQDLYMKWLYECAHM